jgi:hypothetical protein
VGELQKVALSMVKAAGKAGPRLLERDPPAKKPR